MAYRKGRSVATTVWCVRQKKLKGMHRLRVETAEFVATWAKMDDIERKNHSGAVPAFCPDPKCPEYQRPGVAVGTRMVPKLLELVC